MVSARQVLPHHLSLLPEPATLFLFTCPMAVSEIADMLVLGLHAGLSFPVCCFPSFSIHPCSLAAVVLSTHFVALIEIGTDMEREDLVPNIQELRISYERADR